MQVETETHRRSNSRQFSLSMLMLIVTGIGCYLGGRWQGYQQGFRLGIATWDAAPVYPSTYAIEESLLRPKTGGSAPLSLDEFTMQLKNEVMPGVWVETNGKASAMPLPSGSSIAVTGNYLVHESVSRYLKRETEQNNVGSEK